MGIKTIDTYEYNGETVGVRYFDGDIDIDYDPANKQVNLHRAGDSRTARTTLHDFRLLGHIDGLSSLEAHSVENGFVRISADHVDLLADPSTGFIAQYQVSISSFAKLTFQLDPQVHAGGLIFPRVKIDFRFKNDALETADVIVIDESRFNAPFRDDDFSVRLPQGVLILDYRHGGRRPRFHRVEEDVDDAAEYIKRIAATSSSAD